MLPPKLKPKSVFTHTVCKGTSPRLIAECSKSGKRTFDSCSHQTQPLLSRYIRIFFRQHTTTFLLYIIFSKKASYFKKIIYLTPAFLIIKPTPRRRRLNFVIQIRQKVLFFRNTRVCDNRAFRFLRDSRWNSGRFRFCRRIYRSSRASFYQRESSASGGIRRK